MYVYFCYQEGNPHMIKHLLIVIIGVLLFSCTSGNKGSGDTWIGGEIINPKKEYILLQKDGVTLEKIMLNEDNTFLYKFKKPEAGLYSIVHNEYQMFLLEPGDSLMLRVNTIGFDESLHYSGESAKENNYLMELFLQNEKEIEDIPNRYLLDPTNFEAFLDSVDYQKRKQYKEFISNNRPSKLFKKVAQANLDYNRYIKKELYTSVFNRNEARVKNENFPKNFFGYRNHIDLGSEELGTYYPYFTFLNAYLDNLTYAKNENRLDRNPKSFSHTREKLKIIDSLITNDTLKNQLMRGSMRKYLMAAQDADEERTLLALFKEYNNNTNHQSEIETLAKATIKLTPGHKVPNVVLVDTENVSQELQSIIKKPSVLYFWSLESVQHYKDIHSKAAELMSKYPEYQFIGINTDTHYKKWLKAVKYSGYDAQYEYQFDDVQTAERNLVINSINKALVVNEDGVIIESNTNLFEPVFEGQLLGYLNR